MSDEQTGTAAEAVGEAAEQIARLTLERDAAHRALALQRHERFKADIRLAVTWLHRRAGTMNDPHARGILNSAALDLASDLAGGRLGRAFQAEPAALADPSAPQDRSGGAA